MKKNIINAIDYAILFFIIGTMVWIPSFVIAYLLNVLNSELKK